MTFETTAKKSSENPAGRRAFGVKETVHITDVVARAASRAFVKLPPWIPAEAAAKAARLKGAAHVLVDDRGRLCAVPLAALEGARAGGLLSRFTDASTPAVEADATPAAALAAMNRTGASCALVVSGHVLLGLVTRAALVGHPAMPWLSPEEPERNRRAA